MRQVNPHKLISFKNWEFPQFNKGDNVSPFKIIAHGLSLISGNRIKLEVIFKNEKGEEATFTSTTAIGKPFKEHVQNSLRDFGLQGDTSQMETIKKLMLPADGTVLDQSAQFKLLFFPDSGNVKSVERMLTMEDLSKIHGI